MATPEPTSKTPKAFISYSWDDAAHKEWVKQLATRLREDGVDVTLDSWHARLGEDIPAFMERAIRENDFLVSICTPRAREKADHRDGGVGYETRIMAAYAFEGGAGKTFIPVVRREGAEDVTPTWLLGIYGVDLSEGTHYENQYGLLRQTLLGEVEGPPPIGRDRNRTQRPIEPSQQWPPDWYQAEKKRYVPRPGLEKQVVDLFRSLAGPRLVTLKAEGGMGKTRLAIECAGKVRDLFPDGVHFVSLSETLPVEEAVAEAIGRALVMDPKDCLPATVLEHLKGRTTLLVLDNYESVEDPDQKVGRFLKRLITEVHGVRLLVTGRSAIKIKGLEWILEDLNDGMTPEEARVLFLDLARHNWGKARDLTAIEEPQWDRIVELTARIPLAIELAAAWTGDLSLNRIADGLQAKALGRIAELPPGATPSDGVDSRQNSLTCSLDWSYGLLGDRLGPEVQRIFAICGLFADSFDEPTLAVVAGVAEAQNDLILLTNTSLIRRLETDDGSTRYRLHRFTREYAIRSTR